MTNNTDNEKRVEAGNEKSVKKGVFRTVRDKIVGSAFVTEVFLVALSAAFFGLLGVIDEVDFIGLGMIIGMLIGIPAAATFVDLAILISPIELTKKNPQVIFVQILNIVLGVLLSWLYSSEYNGDYLTSIYPGEKHLPIFSEATPTIVVLIALGIVGFLVCRFVPMTKLPPIPTALALAALYIGAVTWTVFGIQTISNVFLAIPPLNFLMLTAYALRLVVSERAEYEREHERKKLSPIGRFFTKASNLPLAALVFALPMLGLIVLVLTLFGQEPNAAIRAWTETADWTFSAHPRPADLPYDGHYLCTVAARGHGRLVKPTRIGMRHGHKITVNRQLSVANAFEELISERTPRFHRALRSFYDKHGRPIAEKIETPVASDVTYLVMKPLEWLFLLVLYTFDSTPENRIALQYPHRPFKKA